MDWLLNYVGFGMGIFRIGRMICNAMDLCNAKAYIMKWVCKLCVGVCLVAKKVWGMNQF